MSSECRVPIHTCDTGLMLMQVTPVITHSHTHTHTSWASSLLYQERAAMLLSLSEMWQNLNPTHQGYASQLWVWMRTDTCSHSFSVPPTHLPLGPIGYDQQGGSRMPGGDKTPSTCIDLPASWPFLTGTGTPPPLPISFLLSHTTDSVSSPVSLDPRSCRSGPGSPAPCLGYVNVVFPSHHPGCLPGSHLI